MIIIPDKGGIVLTNHRGFIVGAGATTIVFLLASAASAEPLRNVTEPLCSSVDADVADSIPTMSANCAAPVADGRRDTLEISMTAARGPAEIGDFKISDAYLYNGSYTPEVLSVDPGDNILINFTNSLSGTASFRTNLHTHGFIVSPNNAPGTPESPIGDSVYALIYAEDATAEQRMVHDASANSVPFRSYDKTADFFIEVPDDHPLGLFW